MERLQPEPVELGLYLGRRIRQARQLRVGLLVGAEAPHGIPERGDVPLPEIPRFLHVYYSKRSPRQNAAREHYRENEKGLV